MVNPHRDRFEFEFHFVARSLKSPQPICQFNFVFETRMKGLMRKSEQKEGEMILIDSRNLGLFEKFFDFSLCLFF